MRYLRGRSRGRPDDLSSVRPARSSQQLSRKDVDTAERCDTGRTASAVLPTMPVTWREPRATSATADMSSLSVNDRISLGIDLEGAGNLSHVEASPPSYNLGDYAYACRNCGDDCYLCNGGLCRACDKYKATTGLDRPEHLHLFYQGMCRVCGEEKRLASRNRPCHDCCRLERSRHDPSAPRICAGCGAGEKRIKTSGWTFAYDEHGGVVSVSFLQSTSDTDWQHCDSCYNRQHYTGRPNVQLPHVPALAAALCGATVGAQC